MIAPVRVLKQRKQLSFRPVFASECLDVSVAAHLLPSVFDFPLAY